MTAASTEKMAYNETNILRERLSARHENSNDSSPPIDSGGEPAQSEKRLTAPDQHDENGISEDGEKFFVPETASVLHTLIYPSLWSVPSLFVLTTMTINLLFALFGGASARVHILIFLCFRLTYNVGLGVLLHYQSKYRVLTKLGRQLLEKQPDSWKSRLLCSLARARMTHLQGFEPDQFPHCFNTWLAFRFIVDIVLNNDGLSYMIVAFKCYSLPDKLGASELIQYVIGLLLAAFNYWAKVDAHRCIGAYSWYWGDCFFHKQQHLKFDGVFELFPHPMYTVGYSLYYGAALLARSNTVLFVSLSAHFMQLGFLIFFENPHIERTYGGVSSDKHSDHVLYDAKEGLFPRKADAILLWRIDFFRSGDVALVFLSLYAVVITMILPDRHMCVLHVIFWHVLHWIGISVVLSTQSSSQAWTNHFLSRGRTLHEAFSSWKTLFNMSRTLSLISFVACAFRVMYVPKSLDEITLKWASHIAIGLGLVLINIYSTISAYKSLGDFATFYGDFFIAKEHYEASTRYSGIYRFLNNPDCVTGYAGLHGLALISQSWTMFFLALASQAANILFVNLIELPHMQKIYKHSIRSVNPIKLAISRRIVETLPVDLIVEAERIQHKAMEEVYHLYQRMRSNSVERSRNVQLSVAKTVQVGSEIECSFESSVMPHDLDWIGLYGVSVPSIPRASKGRWQLVPKQKNGKVLLPASNLPESPGVYELRYHTANSYNVVALTPVLLVSPHIRSPNPSPTSSIELSRDQIDQIVTDDKSKLF